MVATKLMAAQGPNHYAKFVDETKKREQNEFPRSSHAKVIQKCTPAVKTNR